MMNELIKAYTKADPIYPGYVNASRAADGSVVLTVRSDPEVKLGVYVCGYARDKGLPGRCTAGDEHCNNYCNMAPEKGPMAERPAATEQTLCGSTAAVRLSPDEWSAFQTGLGGA